MITELRKKPVLQRIAELNALGMSGEDISKAIKEEFKIEASKYSILRVLKTITAITTEVSSKDKQLVEIIKKVVLTMIEEVKKNLNILNSTRAIVLGKIEEAKGLDQTKEVKILEQYVIDIQNTKDWVIVANKIKDILRIIKAPSFNDSFKLLAYIKELNTQIKVQNDSVRTMNEIMKRLESQTKETKVSTIQSVQMSISNLRELESLGMIKILPEFYKQNNEKEVNENEQYK